MTHDDTRSVGQRWDERYATSGRLWSGDPNGALVSEVSGLSPGTALDVGCGEGADAIWLARHGWRVTALDPSGVALSRAREQAAAAGVEVTWQHATLTAAALDGDFDLVCACYPALPIDEDPLERLAELTSPGGHLVVIHHDDVDPAQHGFDPATRLQPADLVTGLGDGWRIEVDVVRDRAVGGGAGAAHRVDRIVRARRLLG